MDGLTTKKTSHHTAVLLLLLLTQAHAESLWLWNEGCNAVTVNGTEHNITYNDPVSCFNTCGNDTMSVALQNDNCVCRFYNEGTVNNMHCNVTCPGNDVTLCGGQKEKWSVYSKAKEADVYSKGLPINETGCVTIQHVSNNNNSYTLQPCNYTNAHSICSRGLIDSSGCNPQIYDTIKSPNWTYACGHVSQQSSWPNERYLVGFDKVEQCIRNRPYDIQSDFKYWIGLIALNAEDTQTTELTISPTPSGSYGRTTMHRVYSSLDYSVPFSSELETTSLVIVGTENNTLENNNSVLLTDTVSMHVDMTVTLSIMLQGTDSVSSTVNVYQTSIDNNESAARTDLHIVPTPSSTMTIEPPYHSVSEVSESKMTTTIAIAAGGVALCALLAVIGMVVYIRKRDTKQQNLGSTSIYGSDLTGRHSRNAMTTFFDSFPSKFQDDTSESVIRSVTMDTSDIPNLTGGIRADLHMRDGTSTINSNFRSSHVPYINDRAVENEYVLDHL